MSNWNSIKHMNELYILNLNKENNYKSTLPIEIQNLTKDDMIFSINYLNSPNKFNGFNLQIDKVNNEIKSTLFMDVLTHQQTVVYNVDTGGFDYTTVESVTFDNTHTMDYVIVRIIGGNWAVSGSDIGSISIEIWIGDKYIKTIHSGLVIGTPTIPLKHFLCEFELDLVELGNPSSFTLKMFSNTNKGTIKGIEMSGEMGAGYEASFYAVKKNQVKSDVEYSVDILCFKEV